MTRQERALQLLGQTILLDEWNESNFSYIKTLRVDLVGKVPRVLIYNSWSWPEKKEYFCLIGQFVWVQNNVTVEQSAKAIVYNPQCKYKLVP